MLDVGAGAGRLLRDLRLHHGDAVLLRAADVSATVLSTVARANCPACALYSLDLAAAARGTGDETSLAALAEPVAGTAGSLPGNADFVVVSDMLYHLRVGVVPPVAWAWRGGLVPTALVEEGQRRITDALVAHAKVAVVFSDHQQNEAVAAWMARAGATWRAVLTKRHHGGFEEHGVWVLAGGAAGRL